MQNLRQLKAEIRAALQLAIATENEKLEEALLNYRTNLTKLEQEYIGQSSMGAETVRAEEVAPLSASSEQEGFETAGSDIAEKRNVIISFAKALPNTDMRPWQEEIRNLDELPDVGKAANLLYRRADDDSEIELQKLSAPISRTANAEVKLNSETDVVELFESGGYVVEEVAHGKSRMKALQIKDETGKIVLRLYPYSDIRQQNGKYVLSEKSLNIQTILDLIQDNPKSRVKERVFDYAERVLRADEDIIQEDLDYLAANIHLLEGDAETEYTLERLFNDEQFAAAWEARLDSLSSLENPQTEEDEATAVEMVGAVLLQLLTGYTYKTGNKWFDNTLSVISLLTIFTGIGKLQSMVKGFVGKKLLKKALQSVSQSFAMPDRRKKIIMFLDKHFDSILKNESIANGIYSFISGIYAGMELSMPQELDDYLKDIDGN